MKVIEDNNSIPQYLVPLAETLNTWINDTIPDRVDDTAVVVSSRTRLEGYIQDKKAAILYNNVYFTLHRSVGDPYDYTDPIPESKRKAAFGFNYYVPLYYWDIETQSFIEEEEYHVKLAMHCELMHCIEHIIHFAKTGEIDIKGGESNV